MREHLKIGDGSTPEGDPSLASTALVLIEPWHPARGMAQAFIEAQFRAVFGAHPCSSYPTIAALFDDEGRVSAAAGLRLAETSGLFLERYLDEPVEQAVAAAFDCPVARDSIVEIGSLAAANAIAAVSLFEALVAWLAVRRRRYAVATLRIEVEKLLRRSGFELRGIGDAAPSRLGDGATAWGSYYDAGPRVFVGQIAAPNGLPHLRSGLQARLEARSGRRAAGRDS